MVVTDGSTASAAAVDVRSHVNGLNVGVSTDIRKM